MSTLIIPCAGKSTRFPGMRPKWLLTHPDGQPMLLKAIEQLDLTQFNRIIVTIIKDEINESLLTQICANTSIEILILDVPTNSVAETIERTIKLKQIEGSFTIKDCDNSVDFSFPSVQNFIIGVNILDFSQINNLPSKSFIIANEQEIIEDIVEKDIRSNIICAGVYGFENTEIFLEAYYTLQAQMEHNFELYISHIISYIIGMGKAVFIVHLAENFIDYGTLDDWRKIQKQYTTYIVDLDGVVFENVGKYGITNHNNSFIPHISNIETLLKLQNNKAELIFMSARSEKLRELITTNLNLNGFENYKLILSCNHSPRVLINDFAPTNPYPSASAINVVRDSNLKEYIC